MTTAYSKNIPGPITACPVCGSAVYDNTAPGAKKNPKGPDYKCKADGEHAFWLAKGGARKAEYNAGADMPWETPAERADYAKNGAAPSPVANVTQALVTPDKLTALFALHDKCLDHALEQSKRLSEKNVDVGDTPEAVAARSATLFIAAMNKGLGA